MKQTILIFTLTALDVKWAENFLANHYQEKIKILAPTIEAQLTLRERNLPFLDYFTITPQTDYLIPQNYLKPFEKGTFLYECKLVLQKIKEVIKKEKLSFDNYPLEKILHYPLFYECSDVLYAYKLYEQISALQPKIIFFPKNLKLTTLKWTNHAELTCAVLSELCNKNFKISFYKSELTFLVIITKRVERLFKYFEIFCNKLTVFPKILYINMMKLLRLLDKKRLEQQKHAEVIFHSGGLILRYYYSLFELLKSRKIFFLVKTYRQDIEDQLLALKKRLREIPRFPIKKNVFKKNLDQINYRLKQLMNESPSIFEKILWKKINLLIKTQLEKYSQDILQARKIVQLYQPKLFISTHDPSLFALAFILTSQKHKIKTLTLQHGIAMFPFEIRFNSNLVASWGHFTKKYITEHTNRDTNEIVCTGFPEIDKIVKYKKDSLNNIKKFSNNNTIVLSLLLTIYLPFDEYTTKFLHELFAELQKLKSKIKVCIRTHSGQDTQGIIKLSRAYGVKTELNPKISLGQFVEKSDLVLSWDTTAILWPMVLNKPLFHTSSLWGPGFYPTQKYKAAWIPKDAKDLVNKINEFIKNPNIYKELLPGQRKFLEDFAGPLDGKASERLACLVEKLVKEQ